jgi:UDP-N-acetylmuramoyl-L-alanyl-D-glutamate--2,6-diaminopimelate ligase
MKVFFEKFPLVLWNHQEVIWDSRQIEAAPSNSYNKLVFVFPETLTQPEYLAKLKNIARATWITPMGSGFGQEVANVPAHLAQIVAEGCGHPSRSLRIWGVTGTNGKSSSVEILRHLLQASGRRVLQIGTLGISLWQNGICEHSEEMGFTTPLSPQLQHVFLRALAETVTDVVMEVSSHAVAESRAEAVDFDVGLFTNLSHDHLDFHKTMENYFQAKKKLFSEFLERSSKKKKMAVINVDHSYGKRLFSELNSPAIEKIGSSVSKELKVLDKSIQGFRFSYRGTEYSTTLVGDHNLENLLICLQAYESFESAPLAQCVSSIASFPGVRGRLERVGPSGPFVFVDYAHTPDALEKALTTLSTLKKSDAALWVVFGCGGDRDRTKRPVMGEIASRIADHVMVTSDNPRTEDPSRIIGEILKGVSTFKDANVQVEMDRKKAILLALDSLKSEDICVIAGKGHETYQILGQQKIPFSDREVVEAWSRQPKSR